MDTAEYGPCDAAYHIACLRREGELLAGVAERAGLGAPVPACPGWRVRDLLKHLGYVHRWAAGYVRERHPRWVDRASEEQILSGGPGDDTLPGWFRDGHTELVRVLEAADPDMTCWTFLEAPSPLAFWARRQAHETAIHRVDAEQAAAGAGAAGNGAGGTSGAAGTRGAGNGGAAVGPWGGVTFAPRFAADGIDELIMGFLGRDARRGTWDGPHGTLGFHAHEGAGPAAHWRVAAGPGQLAVASMASSSVTRPACATDVAGMARPRYRVVYGRGRSAGHWGPPYWHACWWRVALP